MKVDVRFGSKPHVLIDDAAAIAVEVGGVRYEIVPQLETSLIRVSAAWPVLSQLVISPAGGNVILLGVKI